MNVAHLLIGQARRQPESTAIIEPHSRSDRRITFAQLDEHSDRCAQYLLESGIKADDHVLVFVPMSIDLYLALIAIFRIGAVATFLDPSAGADHINRCCELAKPTAMIAVTKAHLLRIKSKAIRRIHHRFTVGWPIPGTRRWEDAVQCSKRNVIVSRDDDHPALITFTSGSTGVPKGAARSHGFLAAQHASLLKAIDLSSGQIDLATLPIFSLANLASGVTTVIPDADLRRPGFIRPAPVLRQIEKYGISRCVASPAFFERLLAAPDADESLRSIDRVYTGGAPVFPGLLDRMQRAMSKATVAAVYGSTEAEPIAHILRSEISVSDHRAMIAGAGLLAGLPVSDIDLRIAPDRWGLALSPTTKFQFDECCLGPRQPGEIVVHGSHVLTGYLGAVGDETTKWKVDDQIWHRTGDAGYLDNSGRLWLLGRAEAKIEDEFGAIYPFAVECAASHIAGVVRSALIQFENARLLVVQPVPNAKSDLQAILLRELAWANIHEIRMVSQLPLDKRHNAKIDYPALRQMLARSRR